MQIPPHLIIIENSLLARFAALKLKEPKIAMVLGSKILLFGVSKSQFLANEKWVKHEMAHIRQFKQHGFLPFIGKYLVESLRNGYYNNKYEAEARAAEDF